MLDQFLSELKSNPRLRIAVALVFAVLWFYLILTMRETLDRSAREYRSTSIKLGRLQSVMQQGDWTERLNAAKTLQAEMESALWRGDTLGLARAAFQDWLNQQMQRAAVSRPVISMGTANEEATGGQAQAARIDDLWKVRAKLVFDFNPESLNKLLGQMTGNTHHVAIETLHITKAPIPRVELMASAYFQKSDRPPPPGQ
ncbi:MAG: hypothetical protein A3F75_11480 [Betaproteobacteria bacterium RIFCSPLOWO2_12_FULL_64_23]|nr:MAG: hypothetical protein A3F75_11480 [Betaproteobacteria bacterium RIFCSPLOWO2_12_FULL_64_23]